MGKVGFQPGEHHFLENIQVLLREIDGAEAVTIVFYAGPEQWPGLCLWYCTKKTYSVSTIQTTLTYWNYNIYIFENTFDVKSSLFSRIRVLVWQYSNNKPEGQYHEFPLLTWTERDPPV